MIDGGEEAVVRKEDLSEKISKLPERIVEAMESHPDLKEEGGVRQYQSGGRRSAWVDFDESRLTLDLTEDPDYPHKFTLISKTRVEDEKDEKGKRRDLTEKKFEVRFMETEVGERPGGLGKKDIKRVVEFEIEIGDAEGSRVKMVKARESNTSRKRLYEVDPGRRRGWMQGDFQNIERGDRAMGGVDYMRASRSDEERIEFVEGMIEKITAADKGKVK